jgi:SagB-type dehydrogenase family enzyme
VSNADTAIARRFHDETAHTPHSVHTSGHTLEWDIKPFPFKVYTEAPALELPRDIDALPVDTLAALGAAPVPSAERLTLESLTSLLYFSAGVTKKKTYAGGGEVLFRAAASTGALYQTEVYVVAGAVEGLDAGVHHFCPGDFTLRRLRDGDWRAAMATAAADPSLAQRAATVVLTAIYWRNTWKYQARGFRHLYWDSGTMLANLVAAGHALGLAPRVLTGFVDADVNRLLGLDADREAALELVAVGPPLTPAGAPGDAAPASREAPPAIDPATMPLSSEDVDYPALRAMQRDSMLVAPAEVQAWRRRVPPPARVPRGAVRPLPAARAEAGRSLDETIQRRGSSRQFTHAPITAEELATTLWYATRPIDADVPAGLVDPFLVVNAVEGVEPGAYRYWPGAHALELITPGEHRRRSAYLTLEQALGGDAAAVLFFLAPLDAVLQAYGNRGYRLANLEAGVIGGRAYLAAYAQRFGASGLTFYDQEVVRFFAPHAEGLDAIFVTALGRAGRLHL